MPDDDSDVDLWMPVALDVIPCPHCGVYLTAGVDTYNVVQNPSDGFYTPFCNEFHYQMHNKVGLWADTEIVDPAPLDLGE